MKKSMRLLALALALVMTLSVMTCGIKANADPVEDFVGWQLQSSTPGSFLLIWSEYEAISRICCNLYTPLLENDNHGALLPAAATEVTKNEDASVWTFKLRDDITWVDNTGAEKAKCTANDWVTALEWVLNFWKNEGCNTSMPNLMIQGAQEYYEMTKEMTQEEAQALTVDGKFAELVGIKAIDDYTLEYTLTGSIPYFNTVTTAAFMYPINQGQIDEVGVANMVGVDPTQLWVTGPYFVTEYTPNNSIIMEKNPAYYDKEATVFNSYTIKFIEDANKDDMLFEAGEVDTCTLSPANVRLIWEDEGHPFHDMLVHERVGTSNRCMLFNYAKNLEDGETPDVNWNTAVANEAFRLSLYWGMDLTELWANANFVNPEDCIAQTFTTSNVAVFSNGQDYVDRITEILGISGARFDAEKGAAYKAQAMEELSAQGVTFPVDVEYYIQGGNQSQLDTANIYKTIFDECLGTDYVNFVIKTYVSNSRQEVSTPSKNSIQVVGWMADYGDPENFLSCIWAHGSGAFSSNVMHTSVEGLTYCDEMETFSQMAKDSTLIVDDMDARYEAMAQAEAYALQHALLVPLYRDSSWNLTRLNTYGKAPYATYGIQSDVMKNMETNVDGYTTEEYAQIAADYAAGNF